MYDFLQRTSLTLSFEQIQMSICEIFVGKTSSGNIVRHKRKIGKYSLLLLGIPRMCRGMCFYH